MIPLYSKEDNTLSSYHEQIFVFVRQSRKKCINIIANNIIFLEKVPSKTIKNEKSESEINFNIIN